MNFPSGSSVFKDFKLCFFPISLSFLSCAGVIFNAPVPNVASTYSSAMIGIFLLIIGTITSFPKIFLYLSSSGFTQIATSPKIVSGLVVATVIPPALPSAKG